jgi:arabinogalactan oligomer/maltooligosaccharide transport system substrate-binding protein
MPLLAGALSLSACDQAASQNTLTIWHAWGGAELATLKELIAKYRATRPELEIVALQVPHDKLKDKYLRSAAANGGPDLLVGNGDWSGKLAESNLLLRTDELFTKDELARFHPKSLESLKIGDKLYALPESRETVVLYYNKRLMPKPPATVDEMITTAASMAGRSGMQYGMVFNTGFYFSMGYFFGNGMQLFDDKGTLAVKSAGTQAGLSLIDRMSRTKGILTNHEYSKADSLYKEGQTAMIINGPWALVDYQAKLGKDLGLATLPAVAPGKPAASWVGVKCLMFNNNSDAGHRKLAKDFALFVTAPENQMLLATKAGHIPAVIDAKLPADSPLAVFQAQADQGTPANISNEVSLVWDPMDKAIRQVVQHEAGPEAALDEADKTIKAQLKEMRAQSK